MVWSRQSDNIKDVRGSLYFNFCCHLFCHHYSMAFVFNTSVGSHCFSRCFYGSLHFAISPSSYNNVNVKVKQVKCLEAFYNGQDLVAVLPTGYGKLMKAVLCFPSQEYFFKWTSPVDLHNLQQHKTAPAIAL